MQNSLVEPSVQFFKTIYNSIPFVLKSKTPSKSEKKLLTLNMCSFAGRAVSAAEWRRHVQEREKARNGRFLAIWRRGSVTQSGSIVENGNTMVI